MWKHRTKLAYLNLEREFRTTGRQQRLQADEQSLVFTRETELSVSEQQRDPVLNFKHAGDSKHTDVPLLCQKTVDESEESW